MKNSISYLVTVSREHFLPAQMLLLSLKNKTKAEVVVVGNLDKHKIKLIQAMGVKYIDEDAIDYGNRLPNVNWEEKYRKFGWYKQMFIRLSIDKFMKTDQVIILDSEVFAFDNWQEERFYDEKTKKPRSFYWIPEKRKSDWNYKMYQGAAYLLSFLPECEGIMEYANSDNYKRHISGVVLFSTKNVAELWRRLEEGTDLYKNIDTLFNKKDELAFSDHDIYGLALEYGIFDTIVPTVIHEDLLGWYDNHDDPDFFRFQHNAMWSMCQKYADYNTPQKYKEFINNMAKKLNQKVTLINDSNIPDAKMIDDKYDKKKTVEYFEKYNKQLDYSKRKRFATMYGALKLLNSYKHKDPIIVEIGTMRDANKGGGHSTYKFGEYCSRFGGKLYTVDILEQAIDFSISKTTNYQPWIEYIVSDSTKFLKNFDKKIDLLYLDGFDSTPGKEKVASKKQLEEIKYAAPKLADDCIVLLDDTELPMGGKASLSSKYLIKNGFKLKIDGYQQVYVRENDNIQLNKKRTKHTMKKILRKIIPKRIVHEIMRPSRIERDLVELKANFRNHDNRLDKLKALANEVEPYQPTYGISGILTEEPKRRSLDRCRAIEQSLDKVYGLSILDIGSSLGYVCYYFADRGAKTEGWDANPKNAEVSRMVGQINGLDVNIKTKNFDKDGVATIRHGSYDVVTILSVLHHIIYKNGLKYTQELMEELLDRVPVLIVELAKKGEDTKLFWDKAQPKNELEIFDLVKDKIDIKEIGTFHNHLSENKRPLYKVTLKKKTIKVNNNIYIYTHSTNQAYTKSPAPFLDLPRRYYFAQNDIIKEYLFKGKNKSENSRQIIAEVNNMLHLKNIHNMPEMIDYEVTPEGAKLVVKRIPGELLIDIIEAGSTINIKDVVKDVLKTLHDLNKQGLRHNDVRTWNVIYDGKKASLIDYGVVSHRTTDRDDISLLWLISSMLEGKREGYATNKKSLPKKESFNREPWLRRMYERVAKGDSTAKELLKIVD